MSRQWKELARRETRWHACTLPPFSHSGRRAVRDTCVRGHAWQRCTGGGSAWRRPCHMSLPAHVWSGSTALCKDAPLPGGRPSARRTPLCQDAPLPGCLLEEGVSWDIRLPCPAPEDALPGLLPALTLLGRPRDTPVPAPAWVLPGTFLCWDPPPLGTTDDQTRPPGPPTRATCPGHPPGPPARATCPGHLPGAPARAIQQVHLTGSARGEAWRCPCA
eukprot:354096-Chlamydomonas_euryale.AAC.3